MKRIFLLTWEVFKICLMLWGAFTALYVIVLLYHNATSKPTPPPGGWYPPEPGEENDIEP